MEAAAETVRQLTRTTLPELPHQLAQSPDWKCRHIPEEGKRFEERTDTRLQYLTMVNEGDRGVLFTRGYYDIRPEQKPLPKEVNVLSRGSGKKLSLSDYAKKKSGAAISASPSDPPTPSSQKKSGERPPASTEPRSADNPRDVRKVDPGKPSTAEAHGPGKSKPSSTDTVVVDTTLPAKPSFLPDRPPDPDRRKRPGDPDDGARPPKRPRPSSDGRIPEPSLRDDPTRRKNQEPMSSRNQTPTKETKQSSAAPLTNGRVLKSTTSHSRASSPPRARGNSMNGVRPSTTSTQQSSRGTSRTEGSSKSYVPPLLSPLQLDIQDDPDDMGAKRTQKKREADAGKPSKPRNLDTQGYTKAPKSPFKLPPLLSPTLPAEVEAELDRRKKLSPRPADGRPRDDRDGDKRTRVESPDAVQEARIRRSLTVSLKVPKRIRSRFAALMRLSASRKEPRPLDRPASSSGPSHAEKRPVSLNEIPPESMAGKRPRASDMAGSSKPPMPPSTPSKKGATSMSRVSSGNSLAHTPGEAATGTPSVPGSSERMVNGPESQPKGTAAKIASLREKEAALRALGKRLKHNGDVSLKGRQDQSSSTNGNARATEANAKLGYVLILESTLAFMLGFYVQGLHRSLNSKAADPKIWASLLPLLDFIQKDMRRFEANTRQVMQPMHAVSMLLHVVALDEMFKAHATQDNPSDVTVPDLLKLRRNRDRLIPQLRDLNASIDSSLRAQVTLWTTLEDTAEIVLGILRRWCSDERITDYSAQLNLREYGVKNITNLTSHH